MSNYTNGDDRREEIEAASSVVQAIKARRERLAAPPEVKQAHKPLTTEAQLERNIYLTNLALNKYQVKLEDGDELDLTEESRFMALVDSVRKQEVSLAAIQAKQKNDDMGPIEIALELLETGMDEAEVINLYADNKKVLDAIRTRK